MVKLFALVVYHRNNSGEARQLKGAFDLQTFSFFQRGSVQEFMRFTGKIIVERSSPASRSSVKEQDYMCHAYVRADGLSGVLVADTEYPQMVAFKLLTKALDDFAEQVPQASWPTVQECAVTYSELSALLAKYQNPREADAMMKVHEEIEDTKIVLHDTIKAVLDRGEKLDDLVGKSEDLSAQSKMFYTQARKMNKCCSWV